MRIRRMLLVSAAGAALAACGSSGPAIQDGTPVDGGNGAINLAQGWSRDVQQRAWFSSFGSRLIPSAWLAVLEPSDRAQPFMSAAHLDALGFLVQAPTPANPRGFPVGFTRETDAQGVEWAGLGCAACHTGEVRYKGTRIRLDGGQGMLDFDAFEGELVASLDATAVDDTKFARFATALNIASAQQDDLRQRVSALAKKLGERHRMNHVDVAYGHGRLDAFGQIFNAVAAEFLGLPDNARTPDAPVSYPVLWDAPHLDVVQWNGSAPNDGPGPLLQNVTTALAVYGSLDLGEHKGLDGYPSNVDFKSLARIQDDLYALQSPRWPVSVFGPLDARRVARGAQIYAQQCVSCHQLSNRDDPKRRLTAALTPLSEIGTDPRMVQNFLAADARTGMLEGKKEGVLGGPVFGARAPTPDLVVHAAVGAALRHPAAAIRDAVAGYHKVYKASVDSHPDHYKARPLSGIWASAPYLHNGSVPTLADLLKPPPQRTPKFWVGSREFDPDAVGVAVAVRDNATEFDTSLPGNSNAGHLYGTGLDEGAKRDLLEYLKSL